MKRAQSLSNAAAVCIAGLMLLGPASAQPAPVPAPAPVFEPSVGQPGKDVVWVPTGEALVDRMLDIAKVTAADYVIDLGSGDGRTVIAAAKRGARALGIEYDPAMVELSIRNAAREGVSGQANFIKADLFETDFSQATVLTMFLLPDINLKLRPRILDMKPGTRVVSNTFTMGDWTADDTVQSDGDCRSYCRAFFWIVPAKVEGRWRFAEGELALEQKYQMVTGSLSTGGQASPITNGRLTGDQITFTAGGRTFTGRVNGDAMQGVRVAGSQTAEWWATRR